jgi:hypothetical protein
LVSLPTSITSKKLAKIYTRLLLVAGRTKLVYRLVLLPLETVPAVISPLQTIIGLPLPSLQTVTGLTLTRRVPLPSLQTVTGLTLTYKGPILYLRTYIVLLPALLPPVLFSWLCIAYPLLVGAL